MEYFKTILGPLVVVILSLVTYSSPAFASCEAELVADTRACKGDPSSDACAATTEAYEACQARTGDKCQMSCQALVDNDNDNFPAICLQKKAACPRTNAAAPNAEAQVQAAIVKCQTEAGEAEAECMTEPDSGGANTAGAVDSLSQGMAGIAGVCGQVATALNAASAAIVAVKANCTMGHSQCSSACTAATTAIGKLPTERQGPLRAVVNEAKAQCTRAATRARGLENQATQVAQRYQTATACQNDASTTAAQTLTEQCKANPAMIGCPQLLAQDCSNPQVAASSLTCICRANPTASQCNYMKLGGGTPAMGGIDGTSGSRSGANANGAGGGAGGSGFDPGGIGGADDPMGQFKPGPKNTSFNPGGGGGGMGGGGGGGANTAPEKPGAPGSSKKFNTNVNGGYRGGGGAPGFGAPAGQNAGNGYYAGGRNAASDPNGNVSLNRFLPGGAADNRIERNGIVGPDGITGPFSDNWKKMKIRYNSIQRSLKP